LDGVGFDDGVGVVTGEGDGVTTEFGNQEVLALVDEMGSTRRCGGPDGGVGVGDLMRFGV
jgi:hypothetical protein